MSQEIIKIDDIVGGSNLELKTNKTTALTSGSTDNEYPSAKTVFDELELKVDKNGTDRLITTIEAGLIAGAAPQSTTYTKTETDALVVGLWDDRGSFDASVNTYPTIGGSGTTGGIKKGDIWTISVIATSGALLGYAIGATVRALVDTPAQTGSNWSAEQNLTGYVPENSSNKDATGGYSGLTLFAHNFWNATKTFKTTLLGTATQARAITLPDDDGVVALDKNVLKLDQSTPQTVGAIAARVLKGWFTNAEFTNMPTVGGNSLSTKFNPLLVQVASVSVLTTGWTLVSGVYEYSIANANILATSIVDIIPENADSATVLLAELYPKTTSSAGAVKIYANYVPLAAFTVTLNIY